MDNNKFDNTQELEDNNTVRITSDAGEVFDFSVLSDEEIKEFELWLETEAYKRK